MKTRGEILAESTRRVHAIWADYEAREFLHRVKALKDDQEAWHWAFITGGPQTSAIRRQSMELTRALSRMRSSQ